jgi:hypothetical protein
VRRKSAVCAYDAHFFGCAGPLRPGARKNTILAE